MLIGPFGVWFDFDLVDWIKNLLGWGVMFWGGLGGVPPPARYSGAGELLSTMNRNYYLTWRCLASDRMKTSRSFLAPRDISMLLVCPCVSLGRFEVVSM